MGSADFPAITQLVNQLGDKGPSSSVPDSSGAGDVHIRSGVVLYVNSTATNQEDVTVDQVTITSTNAVGTPITGKYGSSTTFTVATVKAYSAVLAIGGTVMPSVPYIGATPTRGQQVVVLTQPPSMWILGAPSTSGTNDIIAVVEAYLEAGVNVSALFTQGVVMQPPTNYPAQNPPALRVEGVVDGNTSLIEVYDADGNPISNEGITGGQIVYGDRQGVRYGVFNGLLGWDGSTNPPGLVVPNSAGNHIYFGSNGPYADLTGLTAQTNDMYIYLGGKQQIDVCTVGGSPGTWALQPVPSNIASTTSVGPLPAMRINNWTTESCPRWAVASATVPAVASGTTRMTAVYLAAGTYVTGLGFMCGSTGATTPTAWWLGLYSSSLVQLAVTANQGSAAINANTLYTPSIATIASGAATQYQTGYSGWYYIGLNISAATLPLLCGPTSSVAAEYLLGLSPSLSGSSDTGLTGPPSFPHTAASLTAVELAFVGAF